jgi:hypothetical protein
MNQRQETDPAVLQENRVLQLVKFVKQTIAQRGMPRSPSSLHTLKQIAKQRARSVFYTLSRFDADDLGERAVEIALNDIQEFGPGETAPTGRCRNCGHALGVHTLPGEHCEYCSCENSEPEVTAA